MYYFLDEETFVETFSIFGFKGGMKDSSIDSSQQIKNMLILQIPNLIMIWMKQERSKELKIMKRFQGWRFRNSLKSVLIKNRPDVHVEI